MLTLCCCILFIYSSFVGMEDDTIQDGFLLVNADDDDIDAIRRQVGNDRRRLLFDKPEHLADR